MAGVRRDPMMARRRFRLGFAPGLALASGAALAVHVAVAVAWSDAGSPALADGAARSRPAALLVRSIAPTELPEPPAPAAPVPVRPAPETATATATAQVSPTDIPVENAAPPTAPANAQGDRRYFGVDEVDVPAAPRAEWSLDIGQLMAANVQALSFEVWVSDAGVAEHCSVTRMEPDLPRLKTALEAQLCGTSMVPARRGGNAVPSVRRIELVLSNGVN